jgi:hypothetical protein
MAPHNSERELCEWFTKTTIADKLAHKSRRHCLELIQEIGRGRKKMTCWLMLCLYITTLLLTEPSRERANRFSQTLKNVRKINIL